jgi:hypothetical protein
VDVGSVETFQRYMMPPFSGPSSPKSISYCRGLKSVTGTLHKCLTVLELVITSSDITATEYNIISLQVQNRYHTCIT